MREKNWKKQTKKTQSMKAQNDVPKSKPAREEKNNRNPKGEKQARMERKKDRRPRARARAKSGKRTQERLLRGF
jgi:hypothetical protein